MFLDTKSIADRSYVGLEIQLLECENMICYFEIVWLATNEYDLNSWFSSYPMVAHYIAHLIA